MTGNIGTNEKPSGDSSEPRSGVMQQADVNAALRALVDDRDVGPILLVAEAISQGEIELTLGRGVATLRVLSTGPRAVLAAALRDLWLRSGLTQHAIAERLEVSNSTIIRSMGGQTVPNWITVKAVIQCMGGEPEEYRSMWQAARRG